MTTNHAAGQCLCGAVEFSATLPSNWIAHCHCTLCQRAHGAAFVTWVSVADTGVTIKGEEDLRWYESSPGAERGFCIKCGSSLFFRSVKWPGELHIVRANFTEDVDRLPQVHAYYETHVGWLSVEDDLPKRSGEG